MHSDGLHHGTGRGIGHNWHDANPRYPAGGDPSAHSDLPRIEGGRRRPDHFFQDSRKSLILVTEASVKVSFGLSLSLVSVSLENCFTMCLVELPEMLMLM